MTTTINSMFPFYCHVCSSDRGIHDIIRHTDGDLMCNICLENAVERKLEETPTMRKSLDEHVVTDTSTEQRQRHEAAAEEQSRVRLQTRTLGTYSNDIVLPTVNTPVATLTEEQGASTVSATQLRPLHLASRIRTSLTRNREQIAANTTSSGVGGRSLADYLSQGLMRSLSRGSPVFNIVVTTGLLDARERQHTSGLSNEQIAWWLASPDMMMDTDGIEPGTESATGWTCTICTDNATCDESGWLVRICAAGNAKHADKDGKHADNNNGEGSHIFHSDCIRKWLVHDNSCPICRRSPVCVPE